MAQTRIWPDTDHVASRFLVLVRLDISSHLFREVQSSNTRPSPVIADLRCETLSKANLREEKQGIPDCSIDFDINSAANRDVAEYYSSSLNGKVPTIYLKLWD